MMGTTFGRRAALLLLFLVPMLALTSCGDADAEKKAQINKLLKQFEDAKQDWGVKTTAYNEIRDKLEKVNTKLQAAKRRKDETAIAEYQPKVDALTPSFSEAQNAFNAAHRKYRDLKTALEDLGWKAPPKASIPAK